jgi:RNA polymerase sigma-70 factor (ECF subfamily)
LAFPKPHPLRRLDPRHGFVDADDPTLVRRTLRGENGAFGVLYERYADRVFRYLLFRVQDSDLAHDLAQDVFVNALKGLPQIQHPERFEGWLIRIAHNRLANHWARRASRPEMEPLDAMLEEEGEDASAKDFAGGSSGERSPSGIDARLHVEALMAGRLNPTQQQVLALRFAAGLSVRETADIIGCSEDAAKQHQYRALSQIRRWLEDPSAPGQAAQSTSGEKSQPAPGKPVRSAPGEEPRP